MEEPFLCIILLVLFFQALVYGISETNETNLVVKSPLPQPKDLKVIVTCYG